jgi:hypothetical protein
MSRRHWIAIVAIVTSACQQEPGTAVRIHPESSTPSFAQGPDTHSRASEVWSGAVLVNGSSVAAGIRGDGRDRQGNTTGTLNEYQDSFCGVRELLYDQRGEDGSLNSDTDIFYDAATMATACGPRRQLAFFLGDANAISTTVTWVGPQMMVDGIWKLTAGQSRLQPQVVGMQLVTCQLRFDATNVGADNIRLSRLPDVTTTDASGHVVGARQWRAESQGNHRAACLVPQANGKYVDTGKRYFLPFSVLITQVPYPFPVYP